MKTFQRIIQGSALLALLALNARFSSAPAQGTAFTYQGQLQDNGGLASGAYDLTFTLFNASSGGAAVVGPVTNSAVAVSNGLFTVVIDFGGGAWNGAINWLEIAVETNGGGGFMTLTPRQEMTPVPYAISAENVSGGGLSGTYGSPVTLNNASNQFTGSYTGNGGGLTNVNAGTLGGLPSASFWQLGGNANVAAGSNVIGTLGNQYLDIRANGVRAMRLRVLTDILGIYTNAPNVIGGSSVNLTGPEVVGATIAGGGGQDTNGNSLFNEVYTDFGAIGGGGNNAVTASFGTVSGGYQNAAGGVYAFVGGGQGNSVVAGSGAVCGGVSNIAGGIASFVGGGGNDAFTTSGNNAQGTASVIGGGLGNNVLSSGSYAFLGGGAANTVSGNQATMGGGANNTASGAQSLVAGGQGNTASGTLAAVAGGYRNMAEGPGSFIGGGGFDGSNYAGNFINSKAATIAGGMNNWIPGGAEYAVIGGGSFNTNDGKGSFIGGGGYDGASYWGNQIQDHAATIGGGLGNRIPVGGSYGCIGGGVGNTVSGISAFIGGGGNDGLSGNSGNLASGGASVVGGGVGNKAESYDATVAGGILNIASGTDSAVAGGAYNTASGFASAVPGGGDNTASGSYSFAAGSYAEALHNNCFVWSDGEGTTNFPSDRVNQFKIQAGGGMYLAVSGSSHLSPAALEINSSSSTSIALWATQSSSDSTAVLGNGGTGDLIKGFSGASQGTLVFEVLNNGTVKSKGVVLSSDRNAKANFTELNAALVLAKVAAMPVTEWNYRDDPADTKHIGPVAQDFHVAFGLNGMDDEHISVVDEGGVALAAIQGLNEKVESRVSALEKELKRRETENGQLKEDNESLAKRVEALEEIIRKHK